MKRIIYLFIFSIAIIINSCSPKITTRLYKNFPPLDFTQEIKVLAITDSIPVKSTQLGTVKLEDSGMTTKCKYDDLIEVAKNEARKVGGNVIKVIEHIPPHSEMHGFTFVYSNCHQITVLILKITEQTNSNKL